MSAVYLCVLEALINEWTIATIEFVVSCTPPVGSINQQVNSAVKAQKKKVEGLTRYFYF